MALKQRALREMALFAGAGGGILGGKLLGWETVCAVEINAFCARRLMQRQNEEHLPPFPIWDDVSTFDGRPWRDRIDMVSGGFPCQGISIAGDGLGLEDPRSGLWKEQCRIIREIRPLHAFVENSPMLVGRGLAVVLGDLAEMGYDARWGVFSAANVGLCHERERIFIFAFDDLQNRIEGLIPASGAGEVRQGRTCSEEYLREILENPLRGNRYAQPLLRRMDDGLGNRVDRIEAIGNGQVPSVVKLAWETLICG